MTREEINKSLERPLLSGNAYEALLPPSDCTSTLLGKGDTSFSIARMRDTALKYQHHTTKLQQKHFTNTDLAQLTKAIHQFLYNHIQYKLDGEEQMLRSPACTWVSRKDGVDCKSYSIFASTILQNAGIHHYFRRIVQPFKPDGFTHVYVVVPKNQKTLYAENPSDYYIIDGTIQPQKELAFIKKDDVLVAPYALTVASLGSPQAPEKKPTVREKKEQLAVKKVKTEKQDLAWLDSNNLSDDELAKQLEEAFANVGSQVHATAKQVTQMAKANAQAITGGVSSAAAGIVAACFAANPLVGAIAAAVAMLASFVARWVTNPCSSAYYTPHIINPRLQEDLLKQFTNTLLFIRKQLNNGTPVACESTINKFLREVDLGIAHYRDAYRRGEKNKCSDANLKGYASLINQIEYLAESLFTGLKTALAEFFSFEVITKEESTSEREWYFIVPSYHYPIKAKYRRLRIQLRSEKKGIYPYNSDLTFDDWLKETAKGLLKFGTEAHDNYIKEMLPFRGQIDKIRKDIWIGVEAQVELERPLQAQQYSIYLKYDEDEKKDLLRIAEDEKKAFELANRSFAEEFRKITRLRIYDEKRRLENIRSIEKDKARQDAAVEEKRLLNISLFAVLGLVLIKKLKK